MSSIREPASEERKQRVSYVIQIWEQPADVALPAHPNAVWEMLGHLSHRSPGTNPRYVELARQLMARFPENDDPNGEGQVWLRGRADGEGTRLVWALGLCSCDQLDEVRATVVSLANALGLNAADEQSGRLHLVQRPPVVSPRTAPGAAPQAAPRVGAAVDETPTEPVPLMSHAPSRLSLGRVAPSAAARAVMARAERRDPQARFELGRLFKLGDGVDASEELAVHWWTLAAELGHRDAQFHLGLAHALGEGVEQSHAKAFKWFCEAADQAHPEALFNLGQMHAEGTGTAKDTVVGSALCYCAHKLDSLHPMPVFQPGETARAMALAALITQSGGAVLDTVAAWRRAEARAAEQPAPITDAPAASSAPAADAVGATTRSAPSWLPRWLRRAKGQTA